MSPLFGVGVKIPYLMIIIAIFLFSANVAVVEPTQEQQQQQQPLMNSTLDSDNYTEETTAVLVASDLRSDLYSPENVQKIDGKGISQLEIFGDSMLPTLSTGDVIYIAANETFETIQPGKVVVFRTLNDRYQSVFVAHRIQELLLSPTIEEDDTTTLWLASGDADPRPNFNDLVLESNYIGTALEATKKGTNFAQPIEPAPPKAMIITTLNEDEERDIISSDDEDISDLAETITSTIIEEESGSDGNIDTLLSEDEPLQDEPLINTRPPSPPSGETSSPPPT
jgi:signal peptidase I